WDPGRPSRPLVRPTAARHPPRSRPGDWAEPDDSTRPRLGSPGPRSDGSRPGGSGGRVNFFSCVLGVGTGDPVLGPLPADAKAANRLPDRLATDALGGDSFGEADLGRQLQRPDAGRLAKGAGTLVQQRPNLLVGHLIHLPVE